MKNFAVNIGRSVGSGGYEIGRLLAIELGWNFYDSELIKAAAVDSGISPEHFAAFDEMKSKTPSCYLECFPGNTGTMGIQNEPVVMSEESLFKINSDTMIKLAQEGNAVFIGRCSDYILRDAAICINVFCYAPIDFRIKNIVENDDIDEAKAEKIISKSDKSRAAYYAKYTDKEWGAAESYHLLIDTSILGIKGSAEYLKDYVLRRVNG